MASGLTRLPVLLALVTAFSACKAAKLGKRTVDRTANNIMSLQLIEIVRSCRTSVDTATDFQWQFFTVPGRRQMPKSLLSYLRLDSNGGRQWPAVAASHAFRQNLA